MRIVRCFGAGAIMVSILGVQARAAETPETILIRKTIDNEKFAKRRGNVEQMLASYGEDVTAYEANGTIDPRGWTVSQENRAALARAFASQLQEKRFDFDRVMSFILVLKPQHEKAIATTVDSGVVIDKSTGESEPLLEERLWFFDKIEDEWLVSGFVQNLGDSTTVGVTRPFDPVPELTELLEQEEEAWEAGSAGSIAGLYNEKLTAYSSENEVNPATWKIIFGHSEDWESWLTKRLRNAKYEIDRNVVYANVGSSGQEAVAVTRETVTTKYDKGPSVHSLDRYVLWLASRKGGSWKINQVFYDVGLPK
jgi:ketosteroid isomerase-like protein